MNITRSTPFGTMTLVGIVLLIGTGCSQPDPKKMLEGDWRVRPTSVVAQTTRIMDDNTTQRQARQMGQFFGSFSLSFRPDGSFTFNMGMPLEGKWTINGKKVTMNVTSMGGRPIPANEKSVLSTFTADLDTKLEVLDLEFPKLGGDTQQLQRLVFEKPTD